MKDFAYIMIALGLLLGGCGPAERKPQQRSDAPGPVKATSRPATQGPSTGKLLGKACVAMAKQIMSKLQPGATVAVLPFIDSDGGVRRLGVLLAGQIEQELANSGAKLVDRDNIGKLLDEIDLRKWAAGQNASVAKAEKFAKADVLVLGSMIYFGNELLISAKALRVGRGTSRIIAATKSVSLPAKPLGRLMWYVRRPSGVEVTGELPPLALRYGFMSLGLSGKVMLRDGETVASGQKFRIHVQPNSDCYLYVLHVDPGNQTQVLFPHRKIGVSNPVRGGATCRVPEGTTWYWFDENKGTETFYLVASYTPLTGLETILATMRASGEDRSRAREAVVREIDTVVSRGTSGKTAGSVKPDGHAIRSRGIGGTDDIGWGADHGTAPGKSQGGGFVVSGYATVVQKITLKHQ